MATDISRNDGTSAAGEAMIPASFAEKSMSSLLRLHGELSEEKERRIDLYRRLMEREQAFAELAGYVRLLETELARRGLDPVAAIREPPSEQPVPVRSIQQRGAPASSREQPAPPAVERQRPAAPGRTGRTGLAEGWKSW